MNVTGVSGLIGTQDYMTFYRHTDSQTALEITPVWRKNNYNGLDISDIPMAGTLPVSATMDGKETEVNHHTFLTRTNWSGMPEEYNGTNINIYLRFTPNCYYLNTTSGEIFGCISRSIDPYFKKVVVRFKRGLLGTPIAEIINTDVIQCLNTLRIGTETGTETVGNFKLEAPTKLMSKGDIVTLTFDNVSTAIVVGKDVPVVDESTMSHSEALKTQAGLIFGTILLKTPSMNLRIEPQNDGSLFLHQYENYGKPFTVSIFCQCALDASKYSLGDITQGVAKTYQTGTGFAVYKEMPRNLLNGQPVYPSYNYNVDGR